jgi:stearoyl-CoA desaturase (delta-9 desaturase)
LDIKTGTRAGRVFSRTVGMVESSVGSAAVFGSLGLLCLTGDLVPSLSLLPTCLGKEPMLSTYLDSTSRAPAIPGVKVLSGKALKFQKGAVLFITVAPFAGLLFAVWSLWGWGLSGVDAGIFLATYVLSGLGVTVGFHRLLTHKSFETKPWLRSLLAIAGSLAIEGSVTSWVAAHRRHHAFSDREGDPHSPHLVEDDSFRGVIKGLWHAQMGWLFTADETSIERWAPDMLRDPVMVRINRRFPIWVVLSLFIIPAASGFVLTRSWHGVLTAFLWGGLARVFLLHHVTWSVNSICHFYGSRDFSTTDESTNNWVLSLVSFGESWHNNHHAFPTSAVHGLKRWQLDASAAFIVLLEKFRLAWEVKRPTVKQLKSKVQLSDTAFSGSSR